MNYTILMNDVRNWFDMVRARILVLMYQAEDTEPMPEDQHSHRERLIAELLALQTRDEKEAVESRQRMEGLGETLRGVETRAAKLREEMNGEHGRQMMRRFDSDARINKIRTALADCAPMAIDTLMGRVNEEIEHLQRSRSMDKQVSNRLAELRKIRDRANDLRVSPLPMADLLTTLRHLERSVPIARERTSSLMAAHH